MLGKPLLALLILATSSFAADIAGEHVGTFSTDDGSTTGAVRNVLTKSATGLECQFFVTLNGTDLTASNPTCKVDAALFTGEYDLVLDDTKMHVIYNAEIDADNSMKGTFKSTSTDGANTSTGTWKTSPKS